MRNSRDYRRCARAFVHRSVAREDQLIQLRAATGSIVERLEQRQYFAFIYYPGTPGQSLYFPNTTADSPQSKDPIRYFDGAPIIHSQDLSSDGFGTPWGQTRTYGDWIGTNGISGNNWTVWELPYLDVQTRVIYFGNSSVSTPGPADTVIPVGRGGEWGGFNTSGANPVPWAPFRRDKLDYKATNTTATLTDQDGGVTVFTKVNGLFVFSTYSDPNGNSISVDGRDASGHPTSVSRTNGSNVERWKYDYITSGSLAGLLSDVKLQRSSDNGCNFATIRQVVYGYYTDPTAQPGNLRDLESVLIEDGGGNVIDHTVYRYYTNNSATNAANFQSGTGYTSGLKYIFNGDSYARASADGFDPTTAADSDAAKYADFYYEYDSQHRVTLETVHAFGSSSSTDNNRGTFQYSYATSTNDAGSTNNWINETIETLPSGSKNYVFMNALGQSLLFIHSNSTDNQQVATFTNYDPSNRVTLVAQPSAVIMPASDAAGTFATYPDLLNNTGSGGSVDYQYLSNTDGKIERRDYYDSSTATPTTPGGGKHELHDVYLQQGESGTLIPQETLTYLSRSNSAQTVFYKAADSVYSDTAGATARTTNYAYAYYDASTTLLPGTVTTTFPSILVSHNGQGTSVALTQVDTFDTYHQKTKTVDADGYTSKWTYDLPTGGLTKYE